MEFFRWLIIKDTYVGCMDPSTEQIRLVLLFDEEFEVSEPGAGNSNARELRLSNKQ